MSTIDELAALERDWDSYGADPIDQRAIATARQILSGSGQPIPRNDGGIDICWLCEVPELGPGLHEISIEIAPNGIVRGEE